MNPFFRNSNPCLKFFPVLVSTAVLAHSGYAGNLSTSEINASIAKIQSDIILNGYNYEVGRTSVSDIPLGELCGFNPELQKSHELPLDSQLTALRKTLALPVTFDWNAQGKCTPVKNQGTCGSCWAFASVGSVEAVLKIFLQENNPDLSEQYLITYDKDYFGCSGGACAYNFMQSGTPLETCFPYGSKSGGDKCPRYFAVASYKSIPNDIASLKTAIYTYGPVFSTVAVTTAFQNYKSGVFNDKSTAAINHCIVLVGWDDGKGAWRLRNSWGSGWGESGYMWIKYGCLQVGSYSSYVVPAGLAAPSNLTALTASLSQINLSWKDNCALESGFLIERKNGTGPYTKIADLGPNVTSYSNTGLTSSTPYTYRIRTYKGSLYSNYSNEATAMTTNLSTPTNLSTITVSTTQITLKWKDNTNLKTAYLIERKTGSGSYSQIASVGSNSTSYTNPGLAINTTYTYRVRAYSSSTKVYSDYSGESSSTTQLSAPTGINLTVVSTSQINITWKDNSTFESGYAVERKVPKGVYNLVASVGANVTSYSNTGLTANTGYSYRVRAFLKQPQLYSSYSPESTATTTVINAPSGLTAVPTSKNMYTVSWKDNSSNEDGFCVEAKKGNGSYARLVTVKKNVTSFVLQMSGMSGVLLTFRAMAYVGSIYSKYSNESSITTKSSASTLSLDQFRTRTLDVIDVRGRCLLRKEIMGPIVIKNQTAQLKLAAGCYVLRIRDGETVSRQRFVIKNKR